MKTNTLCMAIAILVGGLFLIGWTGRSQSTETAWEYKVVYTNMPFSQSELNQPAAEGWQFVESKSYSQAHQALLIFKRAK